MTLLLQADFQWWTAVVHLVQQPTFLRLALALILGACIGSERQWRQRAAGLRTNTLVCFGAAAFVDLGLTLAPGRTQVIAYVVLGVGFLGAGAILKEDGTAHGLNTAATPWCSAAVGACAGAGKLLAAVLVTALLIVFTSVLQPLSRYIDRHSLLRLDRRLFYCLKLFCNAGHQTDAEHEVRRAIASHALALRGLRAERLEERECSVVQAVLESRTDDSQLMHEIVEGLRAFPWTLSVEWTKTEAEVE